MRLEQSRRPRLTIHLENVSKVIECDGGVRALCAQFVVVAIFDRFH